MSGIFETGQKIIDQWKNAGTYSELGISSPRHVRELDIGYNEVTEKKAPSGSNKQGYSFFEKSTDYPIALLEKINSNLALSLGLPVAPCVMGITTPQPTMVSLGLYNDTKSVAQVAYEGFFKSPHADTEQSYHFAKQRQMVLDMMEKEVKGDLHDRLKPYRGLLSEMMPFLLWARINDPNLSNVIDRTDVVAKTPEKGEERKGGYFIDLEGDNSLLSSDYFSEASWDPKRIHDGDLKLVMKDWLAGKLPVEEIFDAEKVWQTVRKIEKLPDSLIHDEVKKMQDMTGTYQFIEGAKKEELIGRLGDVEEMLVARRGQLADFVQKYVPEPAGNRAALRQAPAPRPAA